MIKTGIAIRMIQGWQRGDAPTAFDRAVAESQRRWDFLREAPDFDAASPRQKQEMYEVAMRPVRKYIPA